MVKMMVRSLVQWQYFAPCAHSLESTSLKIGESTKIGVSIGISTWKLLTVCERQQVSLYLMFWQAFAHTLTEINMP